VKPAFWWADLPARAFGWYAVSLCSGPSPSGYWLSDYWYLFTAFVGLHLFQSGFTNCCPMMTLLRKLGVGGEEQLKHA